MKISITGLPKNGLKIFVPKGGKAHTAIIADKTGYKSSCDCLILIPRASGVVDVYFIEMKKKLYYKEQGSAQIFSTIPMWDYLVSMIDIHGAEGLKIKKHFIGKNFAKKHFVVIAEDISRNIAKQAVKPGHRYEYQSNGKSFKVIYSLEEISLKELRCRNP